MFRFIMWQIYKNYNLILLFLVFMRGEYNDDSRENFIHDPLTLLFKYGHLTYDLDQWWLARIYSYMWILLRIRFVLLRISSWLAFPL